MKKNIIKSALLAGIYCLGMSSCQDSLEDVNVNPNNAIDAPLSAITAGMLVGLIQSHEGENARLACMWSQQFTGTDRQYAAFQTYNITSEDFDWGGHYFAIHEQAKFVIQKAEEEGNDFYGGIAKICRAHSYGVATSLWGDMPYSEANNLDLISSPAFDDQMSIYAGVQADLDEAITALSSGSGTDNGGVDFYFGGDKAAWLGVAYTLKARFYMHTGDHAAALAATANGVQAGGDWMIPHTGGQYNQDMNLYYSFGVLDRAGYMTAPGAYLPGILDSAGARNHAKTNEAERFAWLYLVDGDGNYDLNYGGQWAATASFPLVTAMENKLIEAEANAQMGNDQPALDALNEARGMLATAYPTGTYDAFDLTDFDAGGIEDNGQGGITGNLWYEIMEEKYTSMVGQIEVFADLRRTNNLLGLTPTDGVGIPERFLIPQEELDGNLNAPSPIPGLLVPTAVNSN